MTVDTDHHLSEPSTAVSGLAADVAADISAALGETVVPGPSCEHVELTELVPPEGGWVAAAEVPGSGLVALVLCSEFTDRIEQPGQPWTELMDRSLASWAHRHRTVVEELSPPSNAANIDGLLPARDGLAIVSAGLFVADRQVGTAALLVRVPSPSAPVATPRPAELPSADLGALRPLAGVEMAVTAELGRTQLSVSELLNLRPGSVIELDRAAGSPVDVLVNGTLIARGEVVVVDEEFGVRLTEVLNRMED
jgi:flagellar motor switch protein FliN/FliY